MCPNKSAGTGCGLQRLEHGAIVECKACTNTWGPASKKKKKKKIEITIAVFVYHTKVRNQIHCNNSWKVPVQQVGGTGMSWRWDGEWGGFSH